jgi:transcriptional regulator with XRE-family HTH domain
MSKQIMSPEKIGEKVKHLLKEHHMTQDAFADLAFIDVRTARRWLTGSGLDSVSNIIRCADAVGVDVMTILFE